MSSSEVVDGWGTLITPSPTTSTPALRVKTRAFTTITEGVVSSSDTGYGYSFLTGTLYSAGISYAGFDAAFGVDSSGTIVGASYWATSGGNSVSMSTSQPGDGLNLYLTQNPAANSVTNLTYTLPSSGPVQVELMDELGRSVRMLQKGFASAGQNVIAIDPQSLDAGTYFVRVEADGMSAMQKLVITR